MKLNEIYYKLIKENKLNIKLSDNTIFDYLFRKIGIYLSVFFVKLKIHPTYINLANFIFGLTALLVIFIDSNNFRYSIILFLIAYFIDLTDGNVARFYKISSFWGRFLDSMIDILIVSFINIVFLHYVENNFIIKNTGYFALVFCPIYHMIYDKYSSLARWSNLINKTKILPYIRLKKGKRINFICLDLELLILIILLFVKNEQIIIKLIFIFFIIGITKFIFNLSIHLYFAYKYMYYSENQKRNK